MSIKIVNKGVYYYNNQPIKKDSIPDLDYDNAYKNTIAYGILDNHNHNKPTVKNGLLKIKFDCLASHDITYVGIIQTAKASGLQKFPIPYVLTNCHNSLCAVGGTINEDDHMFGYSAAKKYGGIYVPAHQGVIHSYMRERMAGCGKMILGSDSHTRYGALGTMAIGEGGGELVKQLLSKTYDTMYPQVIGVHLTGKPRKGVGPQDVAIALIGATFKSGFVKNKVMEFFGKGVKNLPIEFRNGIDVMTTETTCLSSIWETDDKVKEYLDVHNRGAEYSELKQYGLVYFDGLIKLDLSKIEPMIALPFHPSNAYTIKELLANPYEILSKCEEEGRKLLKNDNFKLTDKIVDGKIKVDQAIIAGCAGGTYDNLMEASAILEGKSIGNKLSMSIYPGSQPIYIDLVNKGAIATYLKAGVNVKTAFCGPCFGAGDVPYNNAFSIRHTTRNFESREGSKPSEGQFASVALMDARSIAATAANGGYLTSAMDIEYTYKKKPFKYDDTIYKNRVLSCYNQANQDNAELQYGPNIADWPELPNLKTNLIMKVCAVINDAVTTTDELIPSGETSSYRSNPMRLAEFTLSRKRPDYVALAKDVQADAKKENLTEEYNNVVKTLNISGEVEIGSVIYATKPGDGSAREQAASCQRVLGGVANIAKEYATKRYRSNLINWGMLPFIYDNKVPLNVGDIIVVENVANVLRDYKIGAKIIRGQEVLNINLTMDSLTDEEKEIILAGCLINRNKKDA
ncbi:MAG TPA: hydratase [Clostridia bacterium]|nr:hydratase [Clostridia bacterium]